MTISKKGIEFQLSFSQNCRPSNDFFPDKNWMTFHVVSTTKIFHIFLIYRTFYIHNCVRKISFKGAALWNWMSNTIFWSLEKILVAIISRLWKLQKTLNAPCNYFHLQYGKWYWNVFQKDHFYLLRYHSIRSKTPDAKIAFAGAPFKGKLHI